jgi:hypothetical protein
VVAYVAQAAHARHRDATLHPGAPRDESMQIGLDEKVMDDVRQGHKVGGTALDVAGWLEDRLLIPPRPGEPGGPSADGDLG